MKRIYALIDYKNRFSSKKGSIPYRSGMDNKLLRKYFKNLDYDVKFLQFSDINFRKIDFRDKIVLYTSSEDKGYHYKNYIEDIILGLKLQGANLIPKYKYLIANNNKLFMEILRELSTNKDFKKLRSVDLG